MGRTIRAAAICLALCCGSAGTLLVSARAERAPPNTCDGVCVDVFGGSLPIPNGFRLKPDFGDVIRFVRLDNSPGNVYGNIQIGKASALPSAESRVQSARDLGAEFKKLSRGSLQIEIMTRVTEQLLAPEPAKYVSVLVYDRHHYVRITDRDPEVWKEMLDGCVRCGTAR